MNFPLKAVISQNNVEKLEPVHLQDLAKVMADQTWVDMRVVPGGIAERVLVVALLIKREEEEVQIEQWLQGEDGNIESRLHWIHAEDIWWIKPTAFSQGDELKPFSGKGQRQSDLAAYDAAVAAVAHYNRVTPGEVDAIAKDRLCGDHYRYWIMVVYKELVPRAKPSDVTALFGYQSIQPLVSARQHTDANNGAVRIPAMVKHAKGLM